MFSKFAFTFVDAQSSESSAIPKWQQELREKKRLQKEKQGGNASRQEDINKQNAGVS